MPHSEDLTKTLSKLTDLVIVQEVLHDNPVLLNSTISTLTTLSTILMSRYVANTKKALHGQD